MDWSAFSYVQIRRDAFSAIECAGLMEAATLAGFGSGKLGDVRRCDIAWVTDPFFVDRLANVGSNSVYGEQFDIIIPPLAGAVQVSRYLAGEEYGWHMDLGAAAMSRRKVTVVLELLTAAEGGGFEVFGAGELDLRPGDVAVFPSFIMHRAKPVLTGRRWSATVWLLGAQPFR